MDALRTFGAPLQTVTLADFSRPGIVFQIGVPPNRNDIVTAIDSVEFDDAWSGRVSTTYGDQDIQVIDRAHLIANKRATSRPQDALDADLLERGTWASDHHLYVAAPRARHIPIVLEYANGAEGLTLAVTENRSR